MAEPVEDFPQGSRNKYPWKQWRNGQVWKLTRGEDFTLKMADFRSTVYAHATRYGLRARLHSEGDIIYLQFAKDAWWEEGGK